MLRHAFRLYLGVLGLALAALLLISAPAAAHPLGNFTISHFSRLTVDGNQLRLHYALDFAEIPTYQELRQIDTNGDREVDQSEEDAYLPGRVEQLRQGLRLTVDGQPLDLKTGGTSMKVALGQNGLRVMRIDADFTAALPAGSGEVQYQDTNFDDQPGWREIVAGAESGATLTESNALATSASDELRTYPQDPSAKLLDMRQVSFHFAPGGAVGAQPGVGLTAHVPAIPSSGLSGRLARLVSLDHATPLVILVSLLAALAWGGAHALTPGHGKAVVAAYLVGARGTARHAVFLGLTVTLTHTAGVFALGAVTLWLSRFILPARLYPWLTVLSGLLVVAIGVTLVWRRARGAHGHDHHHHEHAHDHAHPHDHAHGPGGHHHHHEHVPTRITPRGLLALGVSGGLVPCPSALILLLSAISLGRVGYGIVLVLAFSLGLACVLTGIGLLSVYARGLFQRFAFAPRLPRLLPLASALAVTVAGLAIVAGSLSQTGLL